MCLAFFPFKFGGTGDLEEDIFQFSPVPTMLTIPPSAHFPLKGTRGGWGDVMKRFINFLFKVGLGLDCDCLFLFSSLHPLGPLNKN
jgi:hypothetical protein